MVDQVPWEKGAHRLEVDNRLVLVQITEVLPPGNQELDEIKGQVISDYQTLLEEEWVEELRQKYQVNINEKELDKYMKNITISLALVLVGSLVVACDLFQIKDNQAEIVSETPPLARVYNTYLYPEDLEGLTTEAYQQF